MASVYPDIKPTGLSHRDLVNCLYMVVSSIAGICAKLDDDGTVNDTDYEANCYTAIFSTIIEDSRGNRTGVEASNVYSSIISPTGISTGAIVELLYQIFNSMETLTEQLDTDTGVPATTYEANCYTALLTQNVTNQAGNTLGNGTSFYFNPGGAPQKELVDCLYNLFNCIETLTEQLDADTLGDSDYEATWFTGNCLMRIENSAGNVVGNDPSTYKG